ncbi:GntR family transcriptional regulator [Kribbella sp. NBC_01245]|uniref:GntR family transcriptional regulator n=1 Tax=Kribbella sp. NBC_01245 TaxID=2903578 RepID=UPI002E2B011E|nr:GntR family transcriptional regulator [Kribbella sp. NBC_01245]
MALEVPVFAFRLDRRSGVPPYLQLVHQVRQGVLLGYLQQGDQLPLIREAVEQLAINPNTVSKAYRQLEQEGLAASRPGVGTFITAAPAVTVTPATYTSLRRGLEKWLRSAYEAGLDEEAIVALFSTANHELAQEGVA